MQTNWESLVSVGRSGPYRNASRIFLPELQASPLPLNTPRRVGPVPDSPIVGRLVREVCKGPVEVCYLNGSLELKTAKHGRESEHNTAEDEEQRSTFSVPGHPWEGRGAVVIDA
ncbi:hypothetical protein Bbelb_348300 [Branchiostoma belcheri]|nr:hypothetical protein Bbelb_348300 [Branchiostoma belcheri]